MHGAFPFTNSIHSALIKSRFQAKPASLDPLLNCLLSALTAVNVRCLEYAVSELGLLSSWRIYGRGTGTKVLVFLK